jgi:hypothetical protein
MQRDKPSDTAMEVSVLEKKLLNAPLNDPPPPNIQIVWHDSNDPDMELLCIAGGLLGYRCGTHHSVFGKD